MRVIKAENLAFCIIIHQYTLAQKCAYDRLVSRPFVSLTALKGEDTMSSKALTVRGSCMSVCPAGAVERR